MIQVKKIILSLSRGLAVAVFIAGCSKSGASIGNAALSSVSNLPKISDPVVGNTSSSYQSVRYQTTGGTPLSDFDQKDWSENGGLARAACESASMYKELLNSSIESSKIQCYLGAMLSDTQFDGNYHFFDMSDIKKTGDHGSQHQNSPGQTFKVKVKASKDSNNNIAKFEVFACSNGAQEMYGYQSIDETGCTLKMTFKHKEGRGSESFGNTGNVTATGGINSNGQWTSKHVVAKMNETSNNYQDPDGKGAKIVPSASSSQLTLNEASDHILIEGFHTGNFGNDTFTERFSTASGIVIPAGAGILKRDLTDGSAVRIFQHSGRGQPGLHQENVSWDKDLKLAKTSPWASLLSQVPPDVTTVDTGFTGDQAWDCTGDFKPPNIDLTSIQKFATCETQEQQQFDRIDCWSQQHYQPPPDNSANQPPPSSAPSSGGTGQLPVSTPPSGGTGQPPVSTPPSGGSGQT